MSENWAFYAELAEDLEAMVRKVEKRKPAILADRSDASRLLFPLVEDALQKALQLAKATAKWATSR